MYRTNSCGRGWIKIAIKGLNLGAKMKKRCVILGVVLADVFLPMRASALHCGMEYMPPLVFESVSYDKLESYKKAFIKRLES